MTLLVWVGARLTGTAVPRPLVVWAAIAITALLFGAGHLPTAAALLPLSPLVIARALLFNGLGGMVFGWLYWKRSLVAAMIAHFSADIVLHVLVPVIMQSLMGSVGLRHDQTLGRASPTSARANRQR
jgi:membrane protease YdiL (CAAX protease family)